MSNIETQTKAYEAELNWDHGDKAHRGQTDTGPQAGVKEMKWMKKPNNEQNKSWIQTRTCKVATTYRKPSPSPDLNGLKISVPNIFFSITGQSLIGLPVLGCDQRFAACCKHSVFGFDKSTACLWGPTLYPVVQSSKPPHYFALCIYTLHCSKIK